MHHDGNLYMILSIIRNFCYFFAVEFFDKNVSEGSYQSLV